MPKCYTHSVKQDNYYRYWKYCADNGATTSTSEKWFFDTTNDKLHEKFSLHHTTKFASPATIYYNPFNVFDHTKSNLLHQFIENSPTHFEILV